MSPDDIGLIFFGTWIGLAIAWAVFDWRAGLEAKRRWHPWFPFGPVALFVFFAPLMTGARFLVIVVPPALLIAFLKWKSTEFCSAWGRMEFCGKCGARLDDSTMPPNRPL